MAHPVARPVLEEMAQDEILQIAVLSLFCGMACAALGERAGTAVAWTEELSQVIPKVAGCSMSFAPLAVFASMAAIITARGLRIP